MRADAGEEHLHTLWLSSAALRSVRLRLRLPAGERMTGVTINGGPFRGFDPNTETIDLSGLSGSLWLQVSHS